MTLGKRELLGLIEKERNHLDTLEIEEQVLINGKYQEDQEKEKIHSCSISYSKLIHESRLELLEELLQYYPKRKRKPTKLQIAKRKLKELQKKYSNSNNLKQIELRYDIQELKEFIEASESLKRVKNEIQVQI